MQKRVRHWRGCCNLRGLGLTNQIVDNSKSDSNNFEQRNLFDTKSDNKIEQQIGPTITINV